MTGEWHNGSCERVKIQPHNQLGAIPKLHVVTVYKTLGLLCGFGIIAANYRLPVEKAGSTSLAEGAKVSLKSLRIGVRRARKICAFRETCPDAPDNIIAHQKPPRDGGDQAGRQNPRRGVAQSRRYRPRPQDQRHLPRAHPDEER
jgi:hypothetical protein